MFEIALVIESKFGRTAGQQAGGFSLQRAIIARCALLFLIHGVKQLSEANASHSGVSPGRITFPLFRKERERSARGATTTYGTAPLDLKRWVRCRETALKTVGGAPLGAPPWRRFVSPGP